MIIEERLFSERFFERFYSKDRKKIKKIVQGAKDKIPYSVYRSKFVPAISYIIKELKPKYRVNALSEIVLPFVSKSICGNFDKREYGINISSYLEKYVENIKRNKERGLIEAKLDADSIHFWVMRARGTSKYC